MKKIFFLALGILFFVCENTMNGKGYVNAMRKRQPVSYKTCPVCGMVRDSTWTLYSIYKNDTVWFCRPADKTDFDAHPKKYASDLN